MKVLNLVLIERQFQISQAETVAALQKTITSWLTKELNYPTKDACAVLSAQAFKINSCQTTAHKV